MLDLADVVALALLLSPLKPPATPGQNDAVLARLQLVSITHRLWDPAQEWGAAWLPVGKAVGWAREKLEERGQHRELLGYQQFLLPYPVLRAELRQADQLREGLAKRDDYGSVEEALYWQRVQEQINRRRRPWAAALACHEATTLYSLLDNLRELRRLLDDRALASGQWPSAVPWELIPEPGRRPWLEAEPLRLPHPSKLLTPAPGGTP